MPRIKQTARKSTGTSAPKTAKKRKDEESSSEKESDSSNDDDVKTKTKPAKTAKTTTAKTEPAFSIECKKLFGKNNLYQILSLTKKSNLTESTFYNNNRTKEI
jgi:hypothetical protein